MSHKIAVLNGSGKRKAYKYGATTTKQKENNACVENVIISEDTMSHLKLEVAVSLSRVISCSTSEVKTSKILRTKDTNCEDKHLFSPKTQSSSPAMKALKSDKKHLKRVAIGNRLSPAIREKADLTKTPIPAVPQEFEIKVTPKETPKDVQTTSAMPNSFDTKTEETRKRKKQDSPFVGSPKKLSGGDFLTKSTPKEKTSLSAKSGSSTPTTRQTRTPTNATPSKDTPKRNAASNLNTQERKKNVSKQFSSRTHSLGKNVDKGKAATPTRSPFVAKRQIYQSPRPEGCISPKRKPGTPWRECQLRKLAEEQKAMEKQNKAQLKKTDFVSVSSPKNILKSPLTRPPLRDDTAERLNSSPDFSTCEITSKKRDMAVVSNKGEGTTVVGEKPSVVYSPSGSDVDNHCVKTAEHSAQTTSPTTVMTRFKDKLSQSYSRTVEYFHEFKNIWDNKPGY